MTNTEIPNFPPDIRSYGLSYDVYEKASKIESALNNVKIVSTIVSFVICLCVAQGLNFFVMAVPVIVWAATSLFVKKSVQYSQYLKLKNSVLNFERDFFNYYNNELVNTYSNHLYKKRSDGHTFKEKIIYFKTLLVFLSDANDFLLNVHFELDKYIGYYNQRIGGYTKEKTYGVDEIVSQGNVKGSFKHDLDTPIAPEIYFGQTFKRVNWAKVNKLLADIGDREEDLVMNEEKGYLIKYGRKDLAEKVRHVSHLDGDGAGYDILSFRLDSSPKYIEVKTTTQSIDVPFFMTINELSFFKNNPSNCYLYRVELRDDDPFLKIEGGVELLAAYEFSPVKFKVVKSSIQGGKIYN